MTHVDIRRIPVQMEEGTLAQEDTFEMQLIVCGHACFGAKGNDIVCAAESILVQTLAVMLASLSREELYDFSVDGVEGSGCVAITAIPTKQGWERVRGVFESASTGFFLLAKAYPKHVCIRLNTAVKEEGKDCA